jgi:hypothetical protein
LLAGNRAPHNLSLDRIRAGIRPLRRRETTPRWEPGGRRFAVPTSAYMTPRMTLRSGCDGLARVSPAASAPANQTGGLLPCRLVRWSLKLGLLIVSVATLSATWNAAGSASPGNQVTAARASGGQSSVSLQSGYGRSQTFCAPQPLSGTFSYRVSSGRASLRAVVHHLPRTALVGSDWTNNTVRGYLIGTLQTDDHGTSISGSERLFRPAEAQGYNVVLTWPTNTRALATMWPCRSPAAATLQCERAIGSRLPVTSASVQSCLSGRLTLRHLCPPPSSKIFVIWRGRTYVLSEGKKPSELPQQYGTGAITQSCGPSPST